MTDETPTGEGAQQEPQFLAGVVLLMPLDGSGVRFIPQDPGTQFERKATASDIRAMVSEATAQLDAALVMSTMHRAAQEQQRAMEEARVREELEAQQAGGNGRRGCIRELFARRGSRGPH